jgi:hypothetical protein
MVFHGGDVCPLQSQVLVVLEFSGAGVCGERQLGQRKISLDPISQDGYFKVGSVRQAYHAYWQDQDGEDLHRRGHGAPC